MSEEYYVDLNGETAGPFSLVDLRKLFLGQTITARTLYARQGSVSWLPLETILPLLADERVIAPPAPVQKAKPQAGSGDCFCRACGHVGAPATSTPGSLLIELVLWLCFLVPGLIYSLWRHCARFKVCRVCRQPGIIPAGSPAARDHVEFSGGRDWGLAIVLAAAFVWLVLWLF